MNQTLWPIRYKNSTWPYYHVVETLRCSTQRSTDYLIRFGHWAALHVRDYTLLYTNLGHDDNFRAKSSHWRWKSAQKHFKKLFQCLFCCERDQTLERQLEFCLGQTAEWEISTDLHIILFCKESSWDFYDLSEENFIEAFYENYFFFKEMNSSINLKPLNKKYWYWFYMFIVPKACFVKPLAYEHIWQIWKFPQDPREHDVSTQPELTHNSPQAFLCCIKDELLEWNTWLLLFQFGKSWWESAWKYHIVPLSLLHSFFLSLSKSFTFPISLSLSPPHSFFH